MPLTICCFIDALGWSLVKDRPFLSTELPHRRPLGTILGYSCTCDPTILTGVLPSSHGHFSFYYYSPEKSPFGWMPWLNCLPRQLTSRGRVRHWLSRLLKPFFGYTGYFHIYSMPFEYMPYFDYSEKRDLYQSQGIINGNPTIFDELRSRGTPFHLSDWRRSETYNLTSLQQCIKQGKLSFAYLYLAGLDGLLHQVGCGSPKVEEKLRWYEDQLQALLQLARLHHDDVSLIVFSDHGMTDVREFCDLRRRIEALPLNFGRDYAAVFDSTMVRVWILNERARPVIVQTLQNCPQGRLLSDDDLSGYGCLFPDRRYGEIFWLAHPGVLICPSHLGEQPLRGMHGYQPEDPDSWACLLANFDVAEVHGDLRDLYLMMRGQIGGAANAASG